MNLRQRLTNFTALQSGWIAWLFLGYAMGGAAVFLQRAIHLVLRAGRRRIRARRRLHDALLATSVELSNSGFAPC
jgi:hypothetical protein